MIVAEVLRKKVRPVGAGLRGIKGVVGIEIEVERAPNQHELPFGWTTHHDGSLREAGLELVSTPLNLPAVHAQVQAARDWLKESNPVHEFSHRCSVHVHVSVLHIPVAQLPSVLAVCAAVEPVLLSLVTEQRRSSLFAVPLCQDPGITAAVSAAKEHISNSRYDYALRALQTGKYSAFGLHRLRDLGTIEFRSMYGTHDPDLLTLWCLACAAVVQYGASITTKQLALDLLAGEEAFNRKVFGEIYDDLVAHKISDTLVRFKDAVHTAVSLMLPLSSNGRAVFTELADNVADINEFRATPAFVMQILKEVPVGTVVYNWTRTPEGAEYHGVGADDAAAHIRVEFITAKEVRYRVR